MASASDTTSAAQFRIGIIAFFGFLLFSMLGVRLWHMQVLHRADYTEKALRQSVRSIRMPAVRGRFLCRNGEEIAGNRISWNAKLHLEELRTSRRAETIDNIMDVINRISCLLGRANNLTQSDVSRHMNFRPGVPMEIYRDLSPRENGILWEALSTLPGLEIVPEPVRDYPNGNLAAQTIGYVGASDPGNADDRNDFFYYISDTEGKSGLEYLLNDKLRGTPGHRLVMVNSSGFVHQELENPIPAVNGFDVRLTLDLNAQQIAESLLQDKTGAFILMNANTGALLAMASSPAFPLAAFIPKISSARFKELNDDPKKPFLNRCTMGSYMPGSIIKPLSAIAFLNAGIDPEERINCSGRSPLGYGGIRCNSKFGHGELNMEEAIKRSCNVYFIDVSPRVGIDMLSKVYESAGLGRETGIEIKERSGFLPKNSPSWNEKETAYVVFGQGKIELTPLQAASYAAAIANGGTLWKPFLIQQTLDLSGPKPISLFDAVPEKRGELLATPTMLAIVRNGMYRVVNESGGSGRRARSSKIVVYGKTGTADVGKGDNRSKNVWFIGFASDPRDAALYSFAIMIENGFSGGGTAAPIAAQFFDAWIP